MEDKLLKDKTFSGLGWSALDKLFQQGFVFILGVFLARILGKEAYGLVGVLAIFTGMANILQDSGFSSALIRKKNASESDYTTIFYTNITIGISLYIILFFSAPAISDFYEKPILTNLARFVFLSFLVNSFSVVQNVRLQKNLNYKLIAKINFGSIVLAYSTALLIAYLGYGVWALASQIVLLGFVRTILLWIFSKWRPSGQFSVHILKDFFSFGSKLMCGSILNSFSTNIPQNIIGKEYSLGVTGLYNQAYKLFSTASEFLNGTIQSVPYTVLSTIEDDKRLKRATRKFIRVKALITLPLFMGTILIAETFITVLLGRSWSESAPILQLFCIGGIFTTMDTSNADILRIKGKSGIILSFDIFRTVLIFGVLSIILILKMNYLYIVGGLSFCFFVKYILSTYVANSMINYSAKELIKDVFPYLASTILAVGIGYSLQWFIHKPLLLMITQIGVVGCIYISMLYLLGSVILKEAFSAIRSKIRK